MQKSVSKICMFVAKAIGIGYKFMMDDKKEEEINFGQAYMLNEKFVVKDVNLLEKDKKITASSFTHLNSPRHKYPHQTDGYIMVCLFYGIIFFISNKRALL